VAKDITLAKYGFLPFTFSSEAEAGEFQDDVRKYFNVHGANVVP